MGRKPVESSCVLTASMNMKEFRRYRNMFTGEVRSMIKPVIFCCDASVRSRAASKMRPRDIEAAHCERIDVDGLELLKLTASCRATCEALLARLYCNQTSAVLVEVTQ